MTKKILHKIVLVLLILSSSLFSDEFKKPPYDKRLDTHTYGKIWYDTADNDYESSYNIGVFYRQVIKNNSLAEFWYKKSWNTKKNSISANNLGILYKSKKQYDLAIHWYLEAYYFDKNKDSVNNLGFLYEDLKNNRNAIMWYKKAIERESLDAMKNLSLLYYGQKKYIKAVEYMLPLSDKKYTKKKVFALFRTHWKFDEETIKKGYEAQLKSKIVPEKLKYKGGI